MRIRQRSKAIGEKAPTFYLKEGSIGGLAGHRFFAVGSMLVVSSYWSQRQAEVSQRQAIVDKKAAEKAKKKLLSSDWCRQPRPCRNSMVS